MQGRESMLEQMETYAKLARERAPHCNSEEQTKISLINPYLELLGYDVRNPRQVSFEEGANFYKGRDKVDYAVFRDGEPWLLVEAKKATNPLRDDRPTEQLQRYAMTKRAPYAALTNGRVWRWFRKDTQTQLLEDAPFLEHDVCEPGKREVRWLEGIHPNRWNRDALEQIADEERMRSRFEPWFENAASNPSDDFLKHLLKETGTSGTRTKAMVERGRTAWLATVRARDAQILARASQRQQAERREEPASEKKRQNYRYRWREGANAPWTYAKNGRVAMLAIAELMARQLGVKAVANVWKTKLLGGREAPQRTHDLIPGTGVALQQNLNKERQAWRFARARERMDGLQIETEAGERDEQQPEDRWPWRKVEEASESGQTG